MSKSKGEHTNEYGIILFDGVCNLCNASINFVIDRDKDTYFRYAPLQSETGQDFLKKNNKSLSDFDSIILLEGDTYHTKSTAALRIARRLSALWPIFYVFIVIPKSIRDFVYNIIASNRYKWFGKSDTCRIPTPELKKLFLN